MSVHVKELQSPARACIIWMHGIGADASDMAGLADQLDLNDLPLRHVFIDAPVRPVTINNKIPMRAWYDIFDLSTTADEDKQGIEESEKQIQEVIEQQIKNGIPSEQIYLAGFSQGGAMALFTGLRMSKALGGIISLSAYLPLSAHVEPVQSKQMPIFIAGGSFDPVILPSWTEATVRWLQDRGFDSISRHKYDMDHSVCIEEIHDINSWLREHLLEEVK